jgi:hypothetical protein
MPTKELIAARYGKLRDIRHYEEQQSASGPDVADGDGT